MKSTFALPRRLKRHLLVVYGFTSLFVCLAYGQSDDVHIVPNNVPHQVDPISDSGPDGSAPIPHSKPFRVNVNLVLVPVSVCDFMNRPVVTLKKEDFALYDDDQRQEIQYFSAEQAPLSVAILVDVSKSMSKRVDVEREAIVEFFKNANPDDEYFAITFSDRPRLLASSEQSIDEIEKS